MHPATISFNSSTSNGFRMLPMTNSGLKSRDSEPAVNTITSGRRAASNFASFSSTSQPLVTGIMRSSSMTAYAHCPSFSSASAPFLAVSITSPRRRRIVKSNVRIASSSSTTRIRFSSFCILGPLGGPHFARVLLLCPRSLRFRETIHHLAIEHRKIIGFAAAHPVLVADAFLVFPTRAGVAEIILQRRPARDVTALHEAGGNQQPGSMTDHRDRFAGAVDLLGDLLRLFVDANCVGIDDAARQHQRIEISGIGLRQSHLDFELIRFVMMLESLHFAVFWPDQYAFRACFFESLAGTRHLNLLESIRDDDR